MYRTFLSAALVLSSVVLSPCAFAQEEDPYRQFDDIYLHTFSEKSARPAQAATGESARLNSFVDDAYSDFYRIGSSGSPMEWSDYSDNKSDQRLAFMKGRLAALRSDFDFSALDDEAKITYKLFEVWATRHINLLEYNSHSYPLTHRSGVHTSLASTLMDYYKLYSYDHAENYIARLKGIATVFDQVIAKLESRAAMGVILPKFILPMIIETAEQFIQGAPFDNSDGNSPLFEDFITKVNAAQFLHADTKANLIDRVRTALLDYVKPAYDKLIACLERLEDQATNEAGVWRFPNGKSYYRMLLNYHTTTKLSPNKIHRRGLRNVRRVHRDIRKLMRTIEFEDGDINDFFDFMRTDDRFYYKNSKRGRRLCLEYLQEVIDGMSADLDEMFITTPKTPLEIRAIEAYREKTAGSAFYSRGSVDGSRPGVFYINLYDMRNQPIFELEALAYHEGIPGHHLQISVVQEKDFDAYFRKRVGITAYMEGWALYSEDFPREFGFYQDPYSDFGRLSMELWRACRLVVDTGIHYKKWTRREAIDYLLANTPASEDACAIAIDRYAVMPGQATAYLIGKQKILSLRAQAEKALGEDFDLREFHEIIVTCGAVPLDLLEDIVEDWIETKTNPMPIPLTAFAYSAN